MESLVLLPCGWDCAVRSSSGTVSGRLTGVPLQLGDAYTVTEAGRAEAWSEYVRASKSSRGSSADIFHTKRYRWAGLIVVMRREPDISSAGDVAPMLQTWPCGQVLLPYRG